MTNKSDAIAVWNSRPIEGQLIKENEELKTALSDPEDGSSMFRPKVPYKWKYEQQLERTKRQGQFIKNQQHKLDQLRKENEELKNTLEQFTRLQEQYNQLHIDFIGRGHKIERLKATLKRHLQDDCLYCTQRYKDFDEQPCSDCVKHKHSPGWCFDETLLKESEGE